MPPTISEKRWAALRALREGAAQTFPLLAAVADMNATTLREKASLEKWDKIYLRGRYAEAARERLNAIIRRPAAEWDAAGLDPEMEGLSWADPMPDDDTGRGGAEPAGLDGETVDGAGDPLELLARASQFVSRQILRLMAQAEQRGGRLDKAQIDGLVALSRMMERWEAMARERAGEDKKKSDEELAQMLREIDERIITLAQAEAKRLFQERVGQGVR